jgi:NAD+ synthase (glutamine-hydrolysing)
MKIALSQNNFHIGNFESNTKKIFAAIEQAKDSNADIVVFPELAVSGYPPRDFLEFEDFIARCDAVLNKIAKECKDIAVIIGAPSKNPVIEGKELFNSAVFIAEGEIKQRIHKSLLPTYDVFDEYRYFESGKEFNIIDYKNCKIALTICEDLWDVEEKERMYTIRPMDELLKCKPDIMINIAASPFHFKQMKKRREVLQKNCRMYNLPLLYVNHVGAQTELIFDGGSLVMNSKGEVVEELAYFKEDFTVFDTAMIEEMPSTPLFNASPISLIHDALVLGVRNYFNKLGFKKAILGLSGGIDSAVTLVLAERALGKENVKAILLPSQFSSDHSVKDAEDLAKNLGVSYDIIPIEKSYHQMMDLLSPQFKGLPFDLAEENMQARIRGVILMALSNKFGYILLNTSNKSEAAVGYGTLYGDMCGGLSVIGDVYKMQVFELARYMNKEQEIIPENSIVKPPSAELRPEQKDSDSLPNYEILDEILQLYIEGRKGPAEIIAMGFEKEIVEKILRLVNINEYKRHQTPPILRVSEKAFGMGRRMPIVAKYLS